MKSKIQFLLHKYIDTRIETNINLEQYIQYLDNKILNTTSDTINMSTLSNMSSYFYKEQKLVSYNKSTYCNEVKNLNIDGTQDYYLYNFGYWISTIQNDSFLSYTLHSNCTTAICRDVFSNSIIHKIQKRYIIVQSDYININECKNNINCIQ